MFHFRHLCQTAMRDSSHLAQVSEVAQCRAKRDLLRTKRDLSSLDYHTSKSALTKDKKRPACRAKRDLLGQKRHLVL
jgi:hypothetical protein